MGVHTEWIHAAHAHPTVIGVAEAEDDYAVEVDIGCDRVLVLDTGGDVVCVEGSRDQLHVMLTRALRAVEAFEPEPGLIGTV